MVLEAARRGKEEPVMKREDITWAKPEDVPRATLMTRMPWRHTAAEVLVVAAAWWKVPRVGIERLGGGRCRLVVELGLLRWLAAWLLLGRTSMDAYLFRRQYVPVGVELPVRVRCRCWPALAVEV